MISIFFSIILLVVHGISIIFAMPLSQGVCSDFTIIDTRGTGELQGPSAGFKTMNKRIQAEVLGGNQVDTVYRASLDQNSSQGTQFILNTVKSLVDADGLHCVVLEGYSQGATATVNALSKLTDKYFDAVKAVFLIGNPLHKPGLACNVDSKGEASTKGDNGLFFYGQGGIPSAWIDKTLDVCATGDGVCSRETGFGITIQHLSYIISASTQNLGADFVVEKLKGM